MSFLKDLETMAANERLFIFFVVLWFCGGGVYMCIVCWFSLKKTPKSCEEK